MPTRLLLLLCLTAHVFAREPPEVDCLVVHRKYVHCSWNKQGTPEVNYTFYSRFQPDKFSECSKYLRENNINTGCEQPYQTGQRFRSFNTKLVHGNQIYQKELELKTKVKLNPPTNVTVQRGSDSNLWLNWSQDYVKCVESEVRYRVNNRKWENNHVSTAMQDYCVNLPSSSSIYELQVRSRLAIYCGESVFWSDWSQPVVWGSNNSTDAKTNKSTSEWTPVLYVVAAFILILLVMLLLHHERIRIIFIPVVPKPSSDLHNIEDWFQFPKGLKESFKYNEHPCLVREYCHVSQSDSEAGSVFMPGNESDLSTSCSSSTSTVSTEEEMVSV